MLLRRGMMGGALPIGWDTAFATSPTYSGTYNHVASPVSVPITVRSKKARGAGKVYFEQTVVITSLQQHVGLLSTSAANSVVPGDTAVGMRWDSTGRIYINGVWDRAVSSWSGSGTKTLCFAIDLSADLLWTRLQGVATWNGAGSDDPATATGGIDISTMSGSLFHAANSFQSGASEAGTLRDSAATFLNSPPSGFAPWSGL